MMWRSLLADRRDRRARERQQALEARAQTLAELAAASNLTDRSSAEGVREAMERAAESCRAKRASAWYLASAGRTLICEDSFDRAGYAHTAGAELHRDEFRELFVALEARGSHRCSPGRARSAHPRAGHPLPPAARHRGRTHRADPFRSTAARHADGRGSARWRPAMPAWRSSAWPSPACLRFVICRPPTVGLSLRKPGGCRAGPPTIAEQRIERAIGDRRVASATPALAVRDARRPSWRQAISSRRPSP